MWQVQGLRAPRWHPAEKEKAGAAIAVSAAVPLAYATLAARKKAIEGIGQTKSGLVEDTLIVALGAAVVYFANALKSPLKARLPLRMIPTGHHVRASGRVWHKADIQSHSLWASSGFPI
ncbi:Uncharacterised protein [Leclercia adecarboxylata]|uniref:Uncharacterized protein n=1 Tax=Leclercia adecarboxylata TaxID=83655 RepID=A0A4V6YXY4_9ENTR|nr:Uncharacterised protein [Leclercia adecarboxylata]